MATGDREQGRVFAVIRTRGTAWREGQPLEGQADWAGHAAFMNGLARDGAVILGGPLEGTRDVLLIMRAASAEAVRVRLAEDPWSAMDLLRVARIDPWTLRLGALETAPRAGSR